jgi:pyrimidine-nucleoside phosphorylase
MSNSNPVELITKKRDGRALEPAELGALIEGFMAGRMADYQMSAWLMAAWLRGMTDRETVALTEAMLRSGRVLQHASVKAVKIDKHSTGGVGDKISLCLAPLVAACGVAVPMISGRGLGHTGGTLDKLEAIPGYDVRLSTKRFERVVREVGCSIIGQTAQLAPADARIYALRDVTGTVESIPLIVASILSKKLAAGLDGLVLDVKSGAGAFMKDRASARALARALVSVGRGAGARVSALITDMSSPLGRTVGNALETAEAIAVLQGAGPSDTRELTLALGEQMLLLGGVTRTKASARQQLVRALDDGSALERFARMVAAHGGDARVAEQPSRLPRTRQRVPVSASRSGYVTSIDAFEIGQVSVVLGAGRLRADQPVDPRVGIELEKKPGERVERGEPLAWLYLRSRRDAASALTRIAGAYRVGQRRPRLPPLVMECIPR